MQDINQVFENMDKICKIVSINWCPQSELNYWEADLGGLCSMKTLNSVTAEMERCEFTAEQIGLASSL